MSLAASSFGVQEKLGVSVEDRACRAAQARAASGRRRKIDPVTCDRDYSAAELEFARAIQEYKVSSGRMFPTWSEVLEVLTDLGYQKPARSGTSVATQ